MLQLMGLTGKHQGSSFDVVEGFTISSSKNANLQLINRDSFELEIGVTDLGIFILNTKGRSQKVKCGGELVKNLVLVPGVIFSVGDDGFLVQEVDKKDIDPKATPSQTSIVDLLNSVTINKSHNNISLIKKSVLFKFVRGPLLKTSWEIYTSPTNFGIKSILYFFLDPTIQIEEDFLTLSSDDNDNIYLEGHIPGLISVNGAYLQGQKSISSGDLVEFGQTAFYIEIK